MDTRDYKREYIEFFLHWVIVISTIGAIVFALMGKTDKLGSGGIACFRFYTTDSNVLACLSSLLWLCVSVKRKIPHGLYVFRFLSTVAVTITFLVVVFFLAPMAIVAEEDPKAFLDFFTGTGFVLHFTTPVLSVISFLVSNHYEELKKWEVLWGMLPVLVYSLVYLVLVVFVGVWKDWYGFTFGGRYGLIPLVLLVMYAFTMGVSFGEWKIKKALHRKENVKKSSS